MKRILKHHLALILFCQITSIAFAQEVPQSDFDSKPVPAIRKNFLFLNISPLLGVNYSPLQLTYKHQWKDNIRMRAEFSYLNQNFQTHNSYYEFADTTLVYENEIRNSGKFGLAAGLEWSNYNKPVSFYYSAQLSLGAGNYSIRKTDPVKIPTEVMAYFQIPGGSGLQTSDSTLATHPLEIEIEDNTTFYFTGASFPVGIRAALGQRCEILAEVTPQVGLEYRIINSRFDTGETQTKQYTTFNFDMRQIALHFGYRF